MKLRFWQRLVLPSILVLNLLGATGCDDNFYLSEKEVAAYNSVLLSQAAANLHFDNLQGRAIDLTFDNSTGTPRLQSTNLLAEMRRTEMANLETGPAGRFARPVARRAGNADRQMG